MSFTAELTIVVNAAPMMMPTAMSMTLPRVTNSLNSWTKPMPAPLSGDRREEGTRDRPGPKVQRGGSERPADRQEHAEVVALAPGRGRVVPVVGDLELRDHRVGEVGDQARVALHED